jgi:phosphate transport system substrate-binding protein
MKMRMTVGALLICAVIGCGGDTGDTDGADAVGSGSELSGSIDIDGSSTVYPISQAMGEEFGRANGGKVKVTVGLSGTGGGFKRFCAGETQISDASRPIKAEEEALCKQNNVAFTQYHIATDGIAIVVNPKNTFAQCLTVDELRKMWEPSSRMNTWSQVKAGFPNQPLKLYGPGTNSGTFDYFTEAVAGKQGASRADYTPSEDDNVLVQGVENDAGALGYFGFAYYEVNKAKLRALGVDGGNGCVMPTIETIKNGTYKPLSRPLFIYVNNAALAKPEVKAFVDFYMKNAAELVPSAGYIPLSPAEYEKNLQIAPATSGS